MTWSRDQLVAWVAQVSALPREAHLEILGVRSAVSEAQLAGAFHALADLTHPDRWRHELSPGDTTALVRAYSRVTAAYSSLRETFVAQRERARRMSATQPIRATTPPPIAVSRTITLPPKPATTPPTTPPSAVARTRTPTSGDPVGKAEAFLATAEAAIGSGDLATAQFNLRLAVVAAPLVPKYRQALADLERIIEALR